MLKSLITINLLILLLLIKVQASSQATANDPYIIIQVTDPQFGMFESNKGFTEETELYEKAVSTINRLHPDFVVITGDLVNNKEDRSQKIEFKRITAKINSGIPVWYSPGNHDIGQTPSKEDVDSFKSDYGHDRFSFRHKKSLFIGINSGLIKSNTPILEQEQYNWLSRELKKGKRAKNIVVFCHYPFFISSPDEPETYSNIGIEMRNKYLTLFKSCEVRIVFAGHLHNNGSGRYGTLDMITTSAVGKPLSKAPSGIRIIKVFTDHIESEYFGLEEIPVSMSFSHK